MSEKIKTGGKFNGKYMDFCEEFEPDKAGISDPKASGREWNTFEVPGDEPQHVARPNKNNTNVNEVLRRARAKIGRGILDARVWA